MDPVEVMERYVVATGFIQRALMNDKELLIIIRDCANPGCTQERGRCAVGFSTSPDHGTQLAKDYLD